MAARLNIIKYANSAGKATQLHKSIQYVINREDRGVSNETCIAGWKHCFRRNVTLVYCSCLLICLKHILNDQHSDPATAYVSVWVNNSSLRYSFIHGCQTKMFGECSLFVSERNDFPKRRITVTNVCKTLRDWLTSATFQSISASAR